MAIKTGDTVTLSINPRIKLNKYDALHPFASLSRVIGEGDIPAAELDDMEQELRKLLYRATCLEIHCLNEAYSVLQNEADGTVEGLAAKLLKEIGDVKVSKIVRRPR